MNIIRKLQRVLHVILFTIKSLTYDASRLPSDYLHAALEPLFWCFDKGTSYIGVVMVFMVIILTTSVVVLWYMYLRPVIMMMNPFWTYYHWIVSHYLLVNIVFHYFKAVLTSAGRPPQSTPMEEIKGAVVCKKCVQPKPPRTHHCSICDCCYLKMDHHCPWMNNCIGFFNHRYFVSFCVFMWLGTVYVSTTSFDLFCYHFNHPGTLLDPKKRSSILPFALGIGPVIEKVFETIQINSTFFMDNIEKRIQDYRPHPAGFDEVHEYEHIGIIYLFLLTTAVTVALGMLNCYQIWLISRGETSIEVHVNSSERQKAAKRGMGYNNPYHYGGKNNFRMLFGLNRNRGVLSVLFPSTHLPDGDGISWPSNKKPVHYNDPSAYQRYERANNSFLRKICPC